MKSLQKLIRLSVSSVIMIKRKTKVVKYMVAIYVHPLYEDVSVITSVYGSYHRSASIKNRNKPGKFLFPIVSITYPVDSIQKEIRLAIERLYGSYVLNNNDIDIVSWSKV